jgi:hypothetical protein
VLLVEPSSILELEAAPDDGHLLFGGEFVDGALDPIEPPVDPSSSSNRRVSCSPRNSRVISAICLPSALQH